MPHQANALSTCLFLSLSFLLSLIITVHSFVLPSHQPTQTVPLLTTRSTNILKPFVSLASLRSQQNIDLAQMRRHNDQAIYLGTGKQSRKSSPTALFILKNTYEGTRSRSGRDLLDNDGSGSKQGPSKRQLRVSNLLQIELQQIIHEGYTIKTKDEIQDKLRKKISVVDIDVSPDLSNAKVFVSVYGETFEKREAYIWLVKNTKKIRHALVQKLKGMKRVPELVFKQTDLSKGVDMFVLLENLEEERVENEKKRKEDEQQLYEDKKAKQHQLKKRLNKIDYQELGISSISTAPSTSMSQIFKKGTIKEEDVDRILASFSTADSLDWGNEIDEDIAESELATYDLDRLENDYIEDLQKEGRDQTAKEEEEVEDDDDEDFDWDDDDEDVEEDNEDDDENMLDNIDAVYDEEEWDEDDEMALKGQRMKGKKQQYLGKKPKISVGGEDFADEEEERWIL